MKSIAAAACVALTGLILASPASAAPPEREVVPVDAALEAFLEGLLTPACGVPVSVVGTGKVVSKVFTDGRGETTRAQDNYSQRFVVTNTLTGATYVIRDTGPDRVLFEGGQPVSLQQIGRSTTGSGTIGRTVFDIRNGQSRELSRAGRPFGDFVANACEAIT
jgi:hypothetical protein